MTMATRFLKWVRRIWRKMTSWVQFWKHRAKPSMYEPQKHPLKGAEKVPSDLDVKKLDKLYKEPKVSDLDVSLGLLEPCMLATVKESPAVHSQESGESHDSRSFRQLSQTVAHSVSTLMVSVLQSGWRLCRWKSSVTSASVTCVRSGSSLKTPEAEMLREVYLVLWVIRKQLRELARRQERRHRRRMRSHASHTSRHSDPVQGLKQDARSPL